MFQSKIMKYKEGVGHIGISIVFLMLLMSWTSWASLWISWAADDYPKRVLSSGKLSLLPSKFIVLGSYKPAKRILISDPDISDFAIISPNEIYIADKQPDVTKMTMCKENGAYCSVDLDVGIDVSKIKQGLGENLPGGKDLSVAARGL